MKQIASQVRHWGKFKAPMTGSESTDNDRWAYKRGLLTKLKLSMSRSWESHLRMELVLEVYERAIVLLIGSLAIDFLHSIAISQVLVTIRSTATTV